MKIYRDTKNKGAVNMAVDEYLMLQSAADNEIIWRFSGPKNCVYLGYFQSAEQELDLAKCYADKIDVIRRQTGGGAVYSDSELTYSVCIPIGHPFLKSLGVRESYEQIIQIIIKGLKQLGIKATFKPLNDILVDGKKISGNAQTRRHGVLLQHGTILMDVDVDKMFSYLNVSDEKLRDKFVKSVKSVVTGINHILDVSLSFQALQEHYIAFLQEEFKAYKPEVLDLTEALKEAASEKFVDKYFSDSWNFKY